MTLPPIVRGLVLGIGAAAPIGPVNVQIARRALTRGFWAGFALGCGAVTVDVTYAVLASLSLGPLLTRPMIDRAVSVIGAAVLAYLGIGCLRSAARPPEIGAGPGVSSSARNYFTGLIMTATNPMTLVFWFATVPSSVVPNPAHPTRDLLLVCAGVFASTIGWVCGFAGALAVAKSLGKQGWVRVVDVAGGVLLLAFAGALIWRVAKPFLS
jgi:threonine/homoserine/homoserine lactone efflux protein